MRTPKSDKVILKNLAFKAPLTIYALNKITGYSTSTIHASVHRLMRQNLVKRYEKGYTLGVAGLVKLLQDEAMWEHIDKVAALNKEMIPEYFELWNTFKKLKVNDIATKLLKYSVKKLVSGIPTYPERIEGRKPTLKDWLVRMSIFPEVGVLTKEEHARWFDAVIADNRIYEIYLGTIKWMFESHKATSEVWKKTYEVTVKAKRWAEAKQRLEAIVTNIEDPNERLRTLKEDKVLWETLKEMYNIKDDVQLLERISRELARTLM